MQYVEFTNVSVLTGQPIIITVAPGASGYALLSGLQLALLGTPSIVTQPANQAVDQGSTTTFSVGVVGANPLAYQWLFDNTDISGATNSSYSLTNAQPAGTGSYSVIVTNAYGSVASAVATLSVITLPAIATQPANQVVAQGSNATFSVVANGAIPLAYQWLFNSADISGATSSSYSVTNAQPANAGSYWAVVTNAYGSVTSAVAILTVVVPAPAPSLMWISRTFR